MNEPEKVYKYCPTCKSDLATKNFNGEKALVCSSCGFTFWNNPKPVVSFIYYKDAKILMLQRTNEPFKDYWCLPGGFMRYEETPQESIKREVKEETGLDIEIEGLVGVYRIDNDPRGVHIDIIYHGKANGDIALSEEDKKYNYFDSDDLPEFVAYKHREAILDWLKKSK